MDQYVPEARNIANPLTGAVQSAMNCYLKYIINLFFVNLIPMYFFFTSKIT